MATQGLAVLAATLCVAGEGDWLGEAALACFALGLLLYAYALLRFDFRQTVTGAGDHWVAGGALAISALAASKLTASPLWTGTGHDVLRTLTFVLLGLALAWYAVLLAAEVARPRFHYDARRWATVFPLGMTAVAALTTGVVADVPWLRTLGRVLLWVGVAVWGLVWVGFAWARAGGAWRCAPVPSLLRSWGSAPDPAPQTPEGLRLTGRAGPKATGTFAARPGHAPCARDTRRAAGTRAVRQGRGPRVEPTRILTTCQTIASRRRPPTCSDSTTRCSPWATSTRRSASTSGPGSRSRTAWTRPGSPS
ncbi:hypothetical protein [Streptomyces flavofungini]|uniref:SLAC1 family transporter n=1 Tax=Streptomyces flavofungini TaxID=68200 RepID=UPI0025AFB570|nr:hypothetical protein [Streptomyces flavofungini]WJV46632.1 hypothetical protein QUY26_14520 [Streptomyces flavofungini]